MNHKISIVIIGRNEEHSIGKCIDAAFAAAAQIGGAEMIYVDSNSTDNTVSVAKGFGMTVLTLDAGLRPSPSAGRFVGSKNAEGEFILFLDADTLIYPDFLPKALEFFQSDSTIGGINGRIDDLNEAGERLVEIEDRSDEIMDVKWLRGPACFYRRTALLVAGSFDADLAMEEEAELGLRLIKQDWKLNIIPHPMACHTRCYHGQSIESIISTFRRDIRSKRLGEITKTISHAFRAGNGISFCWLRLKTTILFLGWFLLMAGSLLLPQSFHPEIVIALFAIVGALAIYAKKRSLAQTLLFFPAKILSLADILAGVHKLNLKR